MVNSVIGNYSKCFYVRIVMEVAMKNWVKAKDKVIQKCVRGIAIKA